MSTTTLQSTAEPRRRGAILVDTAAAAKAIDRPAATIRQWASRGHLIRQGTDRRGRALYDLDAVRRVSMGHRPGKRA